MNSGETDSSKITVEDINVTQSQLSNKRISGNTLVPDEKKRRQLAAQLSGLTARMTTTSLKAIEKNLSWFSNLGANDRSWIALVAGQGIDMFVQWLIDEHTEESHPLNIFNAAPRAMARKITLQQTVDLVRTTIDCVEEAISQLPQGQDRDLLTSAVVVYSREVAFAAAEVYAKAAESRGQWDSRMESLVVDAVVRDEPDASIISRASTLGWDRPESVCVIAGPAPANPDPELDMLRIEASQLNLSILASTQGAKLVAVLGGDSLKTEQQALEVVHKLAERFGEGSIVIGDIVNDLSEAHTSARTANSGLRVAKCWPEGPKIITATQLLPERALAGDSLARRSLSRVYETLAHNGSDLMETCVCFLDNTGSVEATARALFVHANTVRYRLKRIEDTTGYCPTSARGAYALRLAITLGRLQYR